MEVQQPQALVPAGPRLPSVSPELPPLRRVEKAIKTATQNLETLKSGIEFLRCCELDRSLPSGTPAAILACLNAPEFQEHLQSARTVVGHTGSLLDNFRHLDFEQLQEDAAIVYEDATRSAHNASHLAARLETFCATTVTTLGVRSTAPTAPPAHHSTPPLAAPSPRRCSRRHGHQGKSVLSSALAAGLLCLVGDQLLQSSRQEEPPSFSQLCKIALTGAVGSAAAAWQRVQQPSAAPQNDSPPGRAELLGGSQLTTNEVLEALRCWVAVMAVELPRFLEWLKDGLQPASALAAGPASRRSISGIKYAAGVEALERLWQEVQEGAPQLQLACRRYVVAAEQAAEALQPQAAREAEGETVQCRSSG